jgi:hypothetical protein
MWYWLLLLLIPIGLIMFVASIFQIGYQRAKGDWPIRSDTKEPLHHFSLTMGSLARATYVTDTRSSTKLHAVLQQAYNGANFFFTLQGVQLTDIELSDLSAIVQRKLEDMATWPSEQRELTTLQSELAEYMATPKYKTVKAQS